MPFGRRVLCATIEATRAATGRVPARKCSLSHRPCKLLGRSRKSSGVGHDFIKQ